MKRIVAVVLAVTGIGGWLTPAAAQKALKAPSLRGANPFIGTRPARARLTIWPSIDNRALFVVTTTLPPRMSWSTEHMTELPARLSWTRSHTALAGAFAITLLIDAAQTRALARQGWPGFRESNPLLGDRPSVGQVNTYTALASLSVLGAAAAVPPRVRPWLLGAALAVEAFTVGSSVRQGLPIRFP
jgi:hypothetical protein